MMGQLPTCLIDCIPHLISWPSIYMRWLFRVEDSTHPPLLLALPLTTRRNIFLPACLPFLAQDFCVNEILADGTLVTVEEGDDADQVVDFTFPEPSAAGADADQKRSDAGGIEGGDCGGGMSSRGGVGVDDSSHAGGG
jgi:hypothetical protein